MDCRFESDGGYVDEATRKLYDFYWHEMTTMDAGSDDPDYCYVFREDLDTLEELFIKAFGLPEEKQ